MGLPVACYAVSHFFIPTCSQTMSSRCHAYLHGFLSGPTSSKGTHLAEQLKLRFATQLHLLDLNGGGGPSMLSHDSAFAAVDRCWQQHGQGPELECGQQQGLGPTFQHLKKPLQDSRVELNAKNATLNTQKA